MQPVQHHSRSIVTAPEKVRPVALQATSAPLVAVNDSSVKAAIFNQPTTYTIGRPIADRPVSERLFIALAEAKVWTSKVAMHLELATRDRLFRQLDVLHDPTEWADGDKPVSLESYKSFVRAIIRHSINSRPALSLMPNGNVLAMWRDGEDKLTIEFLPCNRTRWFVQNSTPAGSERTASTTPLERLRDVLQPYGAERWFNGS